MYIDTVKQMMFFVENLTCDWAKTEFDYLDFRNLGKKLLIQSRMMILEMVINRHRT